ncbi:MAG: hypothetical protein SGI89_11865 [bacterium]|nr:hypothetical protein [bacterium]
MAKNDLKFLVDVGVGSKVEFFLKEFNYDIKSIAAFNKGQSMNVFRAPEFAFKIMREN